MSYHSCSIWELKVHIFVIFFCSKPLFRFIIHNQVHCKILPMCTGSGGMIPYDRNLYLTVTSPDGQDKEIIGAKERCQLLKELVEAPSCL